MLTLLKVENFILIDEAEIVFKKGLSVITGETGAGKSVVIGALNLALGGKANKDTIRNNADRATIQAVFVLDSKMREYIEKTYDIPFEDDQLIIVRTISQSGRSSIRINGIVTPLSILKDLSSGLVDLHGQHEHQSLLNEKNHLKLLDLYGDNDLVKLILEVKNLSAHIIKMDSEIKNVANNQLEINRNLERLNFEIQEISDADIKLNEDNELEERFRTLKNVEDVKVRLNRINQLFESQEFDASGILNGLRESIKMISDYDDMNKELKQFSAELNRSFYELEDLNSQIQNYKENVYFQEEEFMEIQSRLDLINNLKRKYGHSIDEIIEYYEGIKDEYGKTTVALENRKKYEKERANVLEQYNKKAKELSNRRKIIAKQFELEIKTELEELNFTNSTFVVKFSSKDNDGTTVYSNGIDNIEYLISLNSGESPKPLKKIASGGELSRIMLAIKIIFARVDDVPLLVFDEIDTGISGRTAVKVGEKITYVSKYHQIICISHLPQIAVMADEHFLIEKSVENNITSTKIYALSDDERIEEISRLTSVHEVTDKTLEHAKEMLYIAREQKNKI